MPAVPIFPILQRVGEIVGPILVRELSKRRTQEAIRDFVVDVASGKKLPFGKKTKKTQNEFITRRGKRTFRCRMVK